jgi:hypothetical protein
MPVVHACTSSYSGSNDKDTIDSRATQAIKAKTYLKNTQHQKGVVEWLRWWSAYLALVRGPEFKLQYCRKKKEKSVQ